VGQSRLTDRDFSADNLKTAGKAIVRLIAPTTENPTRWE